MSLQWIKQGVTYCLDYSLIRAHITCMCNVNKPGVNMEILNLCLGTPNTKYMRKDPGNAHDHDHDHDHFMGSVVAGINVDVGTMDDFV